MSVLQNPRSHPIWGGPLVAGDYAVLSKSWITEECAKTALLRRVGSQQGKEILGQKGSRDYSGLLIPYYLPGTAGPHSYRIRRDNPEIVFDSKGKTKTERKYLGAPGSTNRLYFPCTVTPGQLADPSLPLVIVEGEKKALAMQRLASHSIETPRFVAIAIPGVWNWRGVVGKTGGPNGERLDVKGPINDLNLITWSGRTVFIIFDANVSSNESVGWARSGLAREITSRHAVVKFINLPPDCGVNGVDDLLGAWGPERVLELFEKAVDGKRLSVNVSPTYHQRSEGIFRSTTQGDRLTETQLANFKAAITLDTCLDDGVETKREFGIEAELNGRAFQFAVSATQFASMDWPMNQIGPNAIVFPNQREYARTAIQTTSVTAEERHVYTYTGWQEINGQQCFLHAGGAIGADGSVPGVNIQLPGQMALYGLRLPTTDDALRSAVRSGLLLAELGESAVTFPLLASVFRAVFGAADFALHLVGETGAFKSELAALAQQFFGPEMNRLHLPGNWSSTANSNETLAFHAKDVLVVIDDFAPQGSGPEVARYHSSADRIFRGAGNGAGRGRLDSNARLREPKPPRGLILSTGEEIPRGHSVRARLLILEVARGSINPRKLSECQRAANARVHAEVMGAFVCWMAGHFDSAQLDYRAKAAKLRFATTCSLGHARTPDIIAGLQAAFEIFIRFCEEYGAIDGTLAAELVERCWKALLAAGASQTKHHQAIEPAARYIELLQSCLASGQAHLASRTGAHPDQAPENCGWRSESGNWRLNGLCIGWINGKDVFLEPAAAYRTVQKASNESGEAFPISEQTLKRRLRDKKLLASFDEARETNTVRRNIAGTQKNVLHLRSSLILPISTDEEASDVDRAT
jgi:hypothetical protein